MLHLTVTTLIGPVTGYFISLINVLLEFPLCFNVRMFVMCTLHSEFEEGLFPCIVKFFKLT